MGLAGFGLELEGWGPHSFGRNKDSIMMSPAAACRLHGHRTAEVRKQVTTSTPTSGAPGSGDKLDRPIHVFEGLILSSEGSRQVRLISALEV